jgi:hypothetical protein
LLAGWPALAGTDGSDTSEVGTDGRSSNMLSSAYKLQLPLPLEVPSVGSEISEDAAELPIALWAPSAI